MIKLKLFVIQFFTRLFSHCKKKNIILFESVPVYADNTKYVYDEMQKRKVFETYKPYWIVDKEMIVSADAAVCGNIKRPGNTIEKLFSVVKCLYFFSVCRFVICESDFPRFDFKDVYYIDLAHGAALKNCSGYYNMPENCCEAMSLSPFLAKYDAINFNCDVSKMNVLGYARNDLLLGEKVSLNDIFSAHADKYIYWMPTYRQHKNGQIDTSSISFPIIYNEDIADEINLCAISHNVIIIVKPHPQQDLSRIKSLQLSNLIFIDNSFLVRNRIENYTLLGSADALITDYSSVYYDYLLCDKPIGLCFDDYNDYCGKTGFTVDPEMILAGGEKIYSLKDMCSFIERISEGEDMLADKRREIRDLCHQYKDNQSTQRITDYIIKRINLSSEK